MDYVSGGKLAAQTNKEKYGDDFYKKIGALGGSTKTYRTKKKGFGSAKHLASSFGKKGGLVSKKGHKLVGYGPDGQPLYVRKEEYGAK